MGIVYVAEPAHSSGHGEPHMIASWWLNAYAALHDDVATGAEATVDLDGENEVQPDLCLFWHPPRTAQGIHLTADDYIEDAPHLVVEIAGSSAPVDPGRKLTAYQRNGVLECVVWLTGERRSERRRLDRDGYVLVQAEGEGMVESAVFPDLRPNVLAMLSGDRRAMRTALS